MLANAFVRSDHPRDEPHCLQIHQLYGIGTFLQQRIQNIVVPADDGDHLVLERTGRFGLCIMMSGFTVLTAESLVCTSVTYLTSALQADSYLSYVLLVLHGANLECIVH